MGLGSFFINVVESDFTYDRIILLFALKSTIKFFLIIMTDEVIVIMDTKLLFFFSKQLKPVIFYVRIVNSCNETKNSLSFYLFSNPFVTFFVTISSPDIRCNCDIQSAITIRINTRRSLNLKFIIYIIIYMYNLIQ